MGAIAPIRTANGALFLGILGTCYPGKIFETQSRAVWTLKFSKCLDSILNMSCENI